MVFKTQSCTQLTGKDGRLITSLSLPISMTAADKGTFLRPRLISASNLNKLITGGWVLGMRLEQNKVRNKAADTLTPVAFSFDSYSVYLKSDESKKNRYGITFFTRSDKYPVSKDFIRGDRSLNLNLQTELLANPKPAILPEYNFPEIKSI